MKVWGVFVISICCHGRCKSIVVAPVGVAKVCCRLDWLLGPLILSVEEEPGILVWKFRKWVTHGDARLFKMGGSRLLSWTEKVESSSTRLFNSTKKSMWGPGLRIGIEYLICWGSVYRWAKPDQLVQFNLDQFRRFSLQVTWNWVQFRINWPNSFVRCRQILSSILHVYTRTWTILVLLAGLCDNF